MIPVSKQIWLLPILLIIGLSSCDTEKSESLEDLIADARVVFTHYVTNGYWLIADVNVIHLDPSLDKSEVVEAIGVEVWNENMTDFRVFTADDIYDNSSYYLQAIAIEPGTEYWIRAFADIGKRITSEVLTFNSGKPIPLRITDVRKNQNKDELTIHLEVHHLLYPVKTAGVALSTDSTFDLGNSEIYAIEDFHWEDQPYYSLSPSRIFSVITALDPSNINYISAFMTDGADTLYSNVFSYSPFPALQLNGLWTDAARTATWRITGNTGVYESFDKDKIKSPYAIRFFEEKIKLDSTPMLRNIKLRSGSFTSHTAEILVFWHNTSNGEIEPFYKYCEIKLITDTVYARIGPETRGQRFIPYFPRNDYATKISE